jgi:hypothetical protein
MIRAVNKPEKFFDIEVGRILQDCEQPIERGRGCRSIPIECDRAPVVMTIWKVITEMLFDSRQLQ